MIQSIIVPVVVSVFAMQALSLLSYVDANFTMGTRGSPFKCNLQGNLWCVGNATSTSEGLTLTPVNRSNTSDSYYWHTYGMALSDYPIELLDTATDRWNSFRTSFRFNIESAVPDWPGDGMAFVMLNNSEYPGSPGGSFGVYDSQGKQKIDTLIIEFDTHQNTLYGDIDDNHVGVDLAEVRSVVARSASDVGINLSGNYSIFAWVDYDSLAQNLEVRISSMDSRPVEAFLNYTVNFFDIFGHNDLVFVGFSASNGYCTCYNFYTVYDWNFEVLSTWGDASKVDTSVLDGRSRVELIAGLSAGTVMVLLVSHLLLYICRKRRKNSKVVKVENTTHQLGLGDIANNLRFSYKQLCVATAQFSESSKLGQGGFGSVYRGQMPGTGQLVAVKRMNDDSNQGAKEFVAEVSIISQLRHRNVVRLLGWCSDKGKFLLVYEYMPNGSLDKVLFHGDDEASVLSWSLRFSIIAGAAEALRYLHEGYRQQIIHRDFKSSNIMLDQEFNAMLGDFGLARMLDRSQKSATTGVAGTFGYIAPEAPATGKFTEKTDVFAFGAVALEIVCGRLAYDSEAPDKDKILVDWVWQKLDQGDLLSVVDPRLKGLYNAQQVQVLLLLGLLCSHPNPDDRPKMRQVVEILGGNVALPPVPSSKPCPVYTKNERHQLLMQALMPMTSQHLEGSIGH